MVNMDKIINIPRGDGSFTVAIAKDNSDGTTSLTLPSDYDESSCLYCRYCSIDKECILHCDLNREIITNFSICNRFEKVGGGIESKEKEV